VGAVLAGIVVVNWYGTFQAVLASDSYRQMWLRGEGWRAAELRNIAETKRRGGRVFLADTLLVRIARRAKGGASGNTHDRPRASSRTSFFRSRATASWAPRKSGSEGIEVLEDGVRDFADMGQDDYNRAAAGERRYGVRALVVTLNLIGCYILLEQGLFHKTLLS
jgi:hypothetical protein